MRFLRASIRLVGVLSATAVFFCLWLMGLPVVAWRRRTLARWRSFIFRYWARTALALLGAQIDAVERGPRAPFFLVANHVSYLDILLLASRVDASFVAKHEVSHWPIVGFLCRCMGTIFVDRSSRGDVVRVLESIEETLEAGQGVVLFPEGTSTNGAEVRRFLPSLLEVAVRLNRPVYYAALRYETPSGEKPASETVCWWGDMTFGSHVLELLTLPGFRARLRFGDDTIQQDDRKRLAESLRDAVVKLLATTDPSTASCR